MMKLTVYVILLLIFLLLTLFICETRGLNLEGQYLLDIKSKFVDDMKNLKNWNSDDSVPCGWTGVRCINYSNPEVLSLNLSSLALSGYLSPSIGGLVHLKDMDLSYNELSGKIPKEIGNCSSLKFLKLNNNQFEGELPVQIGKLLSLEKLIIYNNRITGSLPMEMGTSCLSLNLSLTATTSVDHCLVPLASSRN